MNNRFFIASAAILMLLFSSCKKNVYGVLANGLVGDLGADFPRAPGIACATSDTLMTFENGFLSFSSEHILCVEIEMEEKDFEEMRYESRFGPSTNEGDGKDVLATFFELWQQCDLPWPSTYNWYDANLTIDGLALDQVGIRKKGFLGSVFSSAPSIKLKADRSISGQKFGKSTNITLNNNREDPSRIRMLYNLFLFQKLGYPAPRANLANVSINGELLGAYTHLEAIDDDFLMRAFGNNTGHLYEGQLVDFVTRNVTRWDLKSSSDDGYFTSILNVARILENDQTDNLVGQLSIYINIDRFIDFWVMEMLLDHADGYTANKNNFLIYFDPSDGNRGTFIPWGLNYGNTLGADAEFLSTFVRSALPRQLSKIPEIREKFIERLEFIMENIYDEDELKALVTAYSIQVSSAQTEVNYDGYVSEVKEWIDTRRLLMESLSTLNLPTGDEGIETGCL